MKYMKYVGCIAAIMFTLSFAVFAKDTQSGNFTLDSPAQVGSTQLRAGNYKAEWSGPADAVKVDIVQHGKTVATAEGRIKTLQNPSPYSSVTVRPMANDSNQKTLHEIDFNHRSEALVFGGE
jgi:hypothetical protein